MENSRQSIILNTVRSSHGINLLPWHGILASNMYNHHPESRNTRHNIRVWHECLAIQRLMLHHGSHIIFIWFTKAFNFITACTKHSLPNWTCQWRINLAYCVKKLKADSVNVYCILKIYPIAIQCRNKWDIQDININVMKLTCNIIWIRII